MSIIKNAITQGVEVTVYPKYLQEESNPAAGAYFHAYKITIENKSNHQIQLLKRHWNIMDSLIGHRTVKGDGVVGEQPVLAHAEIFTYTSFCPLKSTIGSMDGYFQFKNLDTDTLFTVKIPEFDLLMPGIFN